MRRILGAEFIGTFVLVLGGCGSAMLAAGIADVGIGFLGVSFAFGLTVLTMAYAVGHISGGHFNPAVTLGLVAGGRFEGKNAPRYIAAQVIGAIAAMAVLYVIANGSPTFDADASSFAANGFDDHSPEGYSLVAAFVTEAVLTGIFLIVIMGATSKRAPAGFAPVAIGLALTLIHLISIPVTNTSVNPARSTGPAIFVADGWAIEQLWLFWVAPLLGGIAGGLLYRFFLEAEDEDAPAIDSGIAIEATGPQREGQLRIRREARDPLPPRPNRGQVAAEDDQEQA